MIDASQDFSTLLNCLISTAVPFASSSLAVGMVAVSLATLAEHPKLNPWIHVIAGFHLAPLIMAPVLFANVLTTFLEARSLEWAQSTSFVAFFGFLFHSFLSYVVLTRVFQWKTRVERTRQLTFNCSRRGVNWTIALLELGPPLAFTLAMVFVFQQSMISVPFFTSRPTILSITRDILNSSRSWGYSFFVTLYVIAVAGVFLILSYQLPRLVAVSTLSRLSKQHTNDVAFSRIRNVSTYSYSPVTGIAMAVVAVSTIVHIGAVALVFVELLSLSRDAGILETGPAWRSLLSPAVVTGLVIFVMWWIRQLTSTSRRLNTKFKSLRSLALVPPSLLGTLGLLFVINRASEVLIGYSFLSIYSYLLLAFFISDSQLASHRLLLQNSRSLNLFARRRVIIILLSALGGVFWPALWAFYFLWVEDGMQVTILSDARTLASLVRGLKQDKLVPGTYLGLLGCCIAWAILAVFISSTTRLRYRILKPQIRKLGILVVLSFLAIISIASSAMATTTESNVRESCSEKQIIVAAGGAYTPKCADVQIDELVLEGIAGSINITAPEAEIEIRKLTVFRGGATLHVNGVSGYEVREFKVMSVTLQGATTEVAQIEFENAKIGYLLISGSSDQQGNKSGMSSKQPVLNILMKESSAGLTIDVHDLKSPELFLQLPQKGKCSVHFEHVSSGSIRIVSADQDEANTSIEGDVTLETHASQQPKISFEKLLLRNLHLDLDGPAGLDLEMSGLKTDPQAKSNLQINAQQGVVNIRTEDLTLAGQFSITGSRSTGQSAEYRVTMYSIGRALKFTNPSPGLSLNIPNLSRLVLKEIDLDQVSLCGTKGQDDLHKSLDIQDVSVTGEAFVPKDLMELLSKQNSGMSRLRLLKMLQDHGVFCGERQLIGVQALYSRKRAELFEVNSVAGWLIDRMTGLGVQMSKIVYTFIFALGLYLVLRCLLLLIDNKRLQSKPTFGAFVDDLLIGALLGSSSQKHSPRMQKTLDILRLVFGWFVFIQVTLCSIYLSQTTLQ